MNNDTAIAELVAGYRRFKSGGMASNQFKRLITEGQKPKVMMIACADSRVDPAIMTDCDPGDIFVVRNVANLVPPYHQDEQHNGTCAALEFAVLGLGVANIIVFGHGKCGGIKALMSQSNDSSSFEFIDNWMVVAEPARKEVLAKHPDCSTDQQAHYCEKISVIKSLDNLMTFPWIAERVESNQLSLHGWYLNFDDSVVEVYQPETQQFVEL